MIDLTDNDVLCVDCNYQMKLRSPAWPGWSAWRDKKGSHLTSHRTKYTVRHPLCINCPQGADWNCLSLLPVNQQWEILLQSTILVMSLSLPAGWWREVRAAHWGHSDWLAPPTSRSARCEERKLNVYNWETFYVDKPESLARSGPFLFLAMIFMMTRLTCLQFGQIIETRQSSPSPLSLHVLGPAEIISVGWQSAGFSNIAVGPSNIPVELSNIPLGLSNIPFGHKTTHGDWLVKLRLTRKLTLHCDTDRK